MFKNVKIFFKAQTSNILVTIIGGLVPLFINEIWKQWNNDKHISFFLSDKDNYMLQSIFIIITVYVLIKIRKRIMFNIEDSEEQIKQYMKKNCGLKIYDRETTIDTAFKTVRGTASQFFYAWLIVWVVWLICYVGELIMSYCIEQPSPICEYCGAELIASVCSSCANYTWQGVGCKMAITTYEQICDFLNSSAMFAIYIILSSVTVNYKKRIKNDYTYLESIFIWTILLIIFISGIIIENCNPQSVMARMMPFYISIVSTITFVLMLGKLNSSYLKIPSFFMFVLYIYAIIQAYIPFKGVVDNSNLWINQYLIYFIPYITLSGKIILMLTICWIAVQRRFIFYIIHRSTTIDRTEELLSELNKEQVSF